MADFINQTKTIRELLPVNNDVFLIPDYQRPYAWEERECEQLWEDVVEDFLTNNNKGHYFLGPIVIFNKSKQSKKEIIDGQQRITTLFLLLRAYIKCLGPSDEVRRIVEMLERCIWKVDNQQRAQKHAPKIEYKVITDDNREIFNKIIETGEVDGDCSKTNYGQNYKYFVKKIEQYHAAHPRDFLELPGKIIGQCNLLTIEADSFESALRIFETLNDRGMPLADSDIFKSQFYEYYQKEKNKDDFINRWNKLEEKCEEAFPKTKNNRYLNELFTQCMYWYRSLADNRDHTVEGLRAFYGKNRYKILRDDNTLKDLELLADFWSSVMNQNKGKFSEDVLKRLFILNYSPNSMWKYIVTVYFMKNHTIKDENTNWKINDNKEFVIFLDKVIALIWGYAFVTPGPSALKTPLFTAMCDIANGTFATFGEAFTETDLRDAINKYQFLNNRPNTRAMLVWWLYNSEVSKPQTLLKLDTKLDIEHIYPAKRNNDICEIAHFETLGNKSVLEKDINVPAGCTPFDERILYYQGKTKGKNVGPTKVQELLDLAGKYNDNEISDFAEEEAAERNTKIIDGFIKFVKDNGMIKSNE